MGNSIIDNLIKQGVKLTPMMDQYYNIKKNYQETLLLFRMGDFYELFFEDAISASKILNISLTHRGKLGDVKIPMAGIPHHAAESYIDKITAQGMKAAICEQIEDPKEAQGIVKRAVTQIVSPALPYSLDKTKTNEHHYIASGFVYENLYYFVYIDFTTGCFSGSIFNSFEQFIEKIYLINPKEFVSSLGQWDSHPMLLKLLDQNSILHTFISSEYFELTYSTSYIEKLIPKYNFDQTIQANSNILNPIGAVAFYICSTQSLDNLVHIKPFTLEVEQEKLSVTHHTLTGLEIIPKHSSQYKESLLGFCDRTKTSMGARNLKNIFLAPLKDIELIKERQNFITYFLSNIDLLEFTRSELENVRDVERIMAKVSTRKVNPGDLINLAKSFNSYEAISNQLIKAPSSFITSLKSPEHSALKKLACSILETINDEIGASIEKGNLIKHNKNKKRDRLYKLCQESNDEVLKLEESYKEKTKISKLKIKSNNIVGFFIEISKSQISKVPKTFERKQTLTNSERYTTKELAEFEKDVLSAKDKLEKLERTIFKDFVDKISSLSTSIVNLGMAISQYDVFQSFAWLTYQEDFTLPVLKENTKIVNIEGAWHPLIKVQIKDQFVCHDINLDNEKHFGLITGPNMAGKTTVMRELAIIQLLAQVGSFVPARKATVGICDYIFSRLGASDNILKGQSTFMLEMTETAEILRHATDKSLIILDEVGRGTSTFDGLSIAWALVEHICQKTKAITLFATHYHELIELAEQLPGSKNFTVETINQNGDVKFLYRLIEEGASQSYGIHVAKLAGLPNDLLMRASEVLSKLENENESNPKINSQITAAPNEQLSMFPENLQKKHEIPDYLKAIDDEIKEIDLINLTPLNALLKLQELKEKQLLH